MDIDRKDTLKGRKKRVRREIRHELDILRRKIAWIETSLKDRSGLDLDDKTIGVFREDLVAASEALAGKLAVFNDTRVELRKD